MPDESPVPEGWAVKPLSTCVDVLDSRRKPVNAKERALRVGPIPYYGATGQVGWIDDYLFDEELVLLGEDGAPFFDKSKPIAYIIDGQTWVNNHAHVLRARREITSNRFLKHYLDAFDFNGYVQGSTRDKLTQGAMNSIPVVLPPREIQDALVAVMDAASDKRTSAASHLTAARRAVKRFRQAVLNAACLGRFTVDWRGSDDLIGWRQAKLQEVCESIADGDHQAPPQVASGVPFVTISAMNDGQLRLEKATRFVTESYYDALKAQRRPQRGDVLFSVTGSIGIPALVETGERFTFQRHIAILRPDPSRILSKYLFYALGTSDISKQALVVATGTAQMTIPLRGLRSFVIALPPEAEQQEIVRRVDQLLALVDGLEQPIQVASMRVERSSQAVLAKAFRGELSSNGGNE